MTTLLSAATGAIVAALTQAPAVAPQVARVRLRPLAANTTTAVVVRPLGAEAPEADMSYGHPIVWFCQIAVECYAKATTATAPDVAVDALVAATYARLMADTTLAGAVCLITPRDVAYDFDVDGEATACATFVFNVRQTAQPAQF
jgi:hypothetical protein